MLREQRTNRGSRRALGSLATFVVLGCGVASLGQTTEELTPQLNREAKALVGERVLHLGTYRQQAAIHLSEEIKFGDRDQYSLGPGFYIRTGQGLDSDAYAPASGADGGRVQATQGAVTLQGSFLLSNDGETIGVITNFYQAVNGKAKGITRTTRPAVSTESCQQVLVYGGKKGSKIMLAYREIWKNIRRPSRDAFVEFDLATSRVVEIRGARIEIIEVTGMSVRYRVLRSFDSN